MPMLGRACPAAMPLLLLAALALQAPAYCAAWWRDVPPRERGPAPYPFPADRSYHTVNEKTGIDESKINVHLVPHTHDDTGWQVTVDQYFQNEVYYVVDTVVDQLIKDPARHFIYVEIGFFARWWDEQPDERRNVTKALVAAGQLEFINGGWCMHDEASPFYVEMVDQTTRGHQFILKNFGAGANPRGTWQIDPFGHSNTQAWLLGAEAGMESMFWGRTDYQDLSYRQSAEGKANNQWPEWVWQGSQSLGKDAVVFAGQLGNHGYGTHMKWDKAGGAVQDNPARHDYNLDEMVESFISSAFQQQNYTKHNHQMWACGSDFQYQNADHWFHNLDKIMHYVNINASRGGPVKAFYSTPSHYTDAVHAATKSHSLGPWEVRSDDIFPLANAAHAYWSGYFTSRPGLKRQVRFASNFLNAARQLEVFTGVTAAQVDVPTVRPSPPVGDSWTDSLEGTVGVATHHDGMSGTERQSVSDDYEQRISESHFEVEAGVAKALQKLSGSGAALGHCNCNAAGNCLNMSMCAYTTGVASVSVVAWNPLGQAAAPWLRIPVSGAGWAVTDAAGKAVASQTTLIDARTHELPLLYINNFGLNNASRQAAQKAYANQATHTLSFQAALPPVGYSVFALKRAAHEAEVAAPGSLAKALKGVPAKVSNGVYEVSIDEEAGVITSVKNLASGAETPLSLTWGYYVSSEGGCTQLPDGTSDCSTQPSGAYIFRPVNQTTVPVSSVDGSRATKPTIEVTQGALITEIKQTFAGWATHVVRLKKGSKYIEVEWTAGPIPMGGGKPLGPPGKAPGGCQGWKQTTGCDAHGKREPSSDKGCGAKLSSGGESGYCLCAHGVKVFGVGCGHPAGADTCEQACNKPQPAPVSPAQGKEVVLKFTSALKSKGTFYTDSNGREMVKRQRDARGPSYPPLVVNEPVAGNYYPVNSIISLDDGETEMAVVTDVSMGGASMSDGELELMVHRRVLKDDHRGVQEPLNETMCGCNDIGAAPGAMGKNGHEADGGCECAGLTMRGVAYLVVDKLGDAHASRRQLVEELNFGPTLAFAKGAADFPHKTFSAVSAALPPNIKLLTLNANYKSFNGGKILLRLAHMYAVDEHPTLSLPTTVDLGQVFGQGRLTEVVETTLTGNQPRAFFEARRHSWATHDPTHGRMLASPNAHETRPPFDEAAQTVTLRPMDVRTFTLKLKLA